MKVGDYVRTKKGEIGKIIGYVDEPTDYYFNCYVTTLKTNFTDTYITEYDNNIKSSPNIIDLIEVGDYVNGCYVTNRQASHNEGITIIPKRIGIIKCNAYFNQGNYNDCEFKWVEEKDIKSIVTKECFESMEYKVGE